MQQKLLVRSLIAAGLVAASVVGYVRAGTPPAVHATTAPAAVAAPAAPVAVAAPAATTKLPGFSWIVEKYGPAVVNVSVEGKTTAAAAPTPMPEMPGMDPNDPFYEFFKRFQGGGPMPRGGMPTHGQGSGFIVSADGRILTNAHVVDGAQEVTVKLTDRREFKAKVLGVDRQTDVAVLKIEATNLPTVVMGNSADTKVGEWVLAIGSPFGFENSVTAGIVSAKARALPDESLVPFIQTDVAVNPGNSGGPLFNMKGEVIGINSQIFSQTGGYQGLSFAVPVEVASKVTDQLVAHGKVTRGRMGVTIQNVNQALAESFGLSKPMGALVSSVEKGSPAEKAGIEAGDVIVKFDGKEVADSAQLPARVAEMKPGATAKLEIIHKGSTKELNVMVGELKDGKVAVAGGTQQEPGRLGVAVRPLNADEQREAGVKEGLVVENATGPAARAGIQPGDVILSVNGTSIRSVDQLRSLVSKAGKHVAILVQREEARIFVPVDLG
jgi:serine protease Do